MSTQLADHLKLTAQTNNRLTVSGLRGSSPALLISILASTENCCCIVADEHQVGVLEDDLRLFSNIQILTYPGYEIPPYTPLSPDQATIAARLSTLYQLLDPAARFILIVSAEALMRRIMPKEILTGSAELLMTGEEYAQDELITSLIHLGYEQVSLVQTVGNFSVRGGIIDIYPPPFTMNAGQGWPNVASFKDGDRASGKMLQDGPIRLDFFGDTIESIRVFDPITQRSQQELPEAILLPVSDILFPLPA
ncbi:MAG: hypothetical protein PHZ02_16895 [Desulfocapsaceae bacterium]|nr:hypothetical protein [Desulfocapsaceae bacterium]